MTSSNGVCPPVRDAAYRYRLIRFFTSCPLLKALRPRSEVQVAKVNYRRIGE